MGVIANDPAVYDLVASSVRVERVATGFRFTEGPVWHPDGYLLFSDIPGDVRTRWTEEEGAVPVLSPSSKANGMTLDSELRLLVCEHWTSSLVRATLAADGTEASREVLASRYEGRALNSPNDVVVASDGTIWFTDPTYGRMDVFGNPREQELDFQGLYRIPPDGELELAASDFEQPNGLCFSPDETALYVVDSGSGHHIRRFSVGEGGALSGGEVLIDAVGSVDDFPAGGCDGLKCDERGTIWVTGPGGVWIVSPDGEHLGTVELPERAGNLAWGGPGWDVLYVAASTSVYRFETKTRGARTCFMR